MSPSLSWIDRDRLETAMKRAGVGDAQHGSPPPPGGSGYPRGAAPELSGVRTIEGKRLSDRLEQLMRHVEEIAGAKDLFVADDQGLPLCERGSRQALRPIAAAFAHFKSRIDRSFEKHSSSNLVVDLGSEGVLHVLTVETGMGGFALCFLATRAVPRHRLMEALKLTRLALEDAEEG